MPNVFFDKNTVTTKNNKIRSSVTLPAAQNGRMSIINCSSLL